MREIRSQVPATKQIPNVNRNERDETREAASCMQAGMQESSLVRSCKTRTCPRMDDGPSKGLVIQSHVVDIAVLTASSHALRVN